MTIEKRHDDCETCDRMAREAERTAVELGRDSWVSEDGTSYLLISEIREAERRERLQERFERQLARLRRLSNRRDTTP